MSINLKDIHNDFVKQLTAYEQDAQEAAELEELLQFLYNSPNNQGLSKDNPFQILTQDYLNILRDDITKLLSNSNEAMRTTLNTAKNLQLWEKNEYIIGKVFSDIIHAAIDKSIKNEEIKDFSQLDFKKTLMGKETATTIKRGIKNLKDSTIETQWARRFGKIDVSGERLLSLNENYEIKPELLNKLLALSASVKTYKDFTLHLERVNHYKALDGIINFLYAKQDAKSPNSQITYFKLRQKIRNKQGNINTHLNHIVQIYALTGIGQTYYIKNENSISIDDAIKTFARFLIYISPDGQKVRVFSTAQLIKENILNIPKTSPVIEGYFKSRITSNSRAEVTFTFK